MKVRTGECLGLSSTQRGGWATNEAERGIADEPEGCQPLTFWGHGLSDRLAAILICGPKPYCRL